MRRSGREEELQILVDHGVRVLDVIVEHPLYGEMRGSLMIESRADVQDFRRPLAEHQSQPAFVTDARRTSAHGGGERPEMIARAKAQLHDARIVAEMTAADRHGWQRTPRQASSCERAFFRGEQLRLENPRLS